jgi:hypothetical protein
MRRMSLKRQCVLGMYECGSIGTKVEMLCRVLLPWNGNEEKERERGRKMVEQRDEMREDMRDGEVSWQMVNGTGQRCGRPQTEAHEIVTIDGR